MAVAALGARADDWAPNFTGAAVWNSNLSNADNQADQIDSLALKGDLIASQRYGMGRDDSFHLGVHFGAEWFPRYEGLTNGAGGLRAEWQHKFGLGALAPTFSVEGAADGVAAEETGRRGTNAALTFAIRKRFDDLTRGSISHGWSRYNARFSVFDRTANETTVAVDRDLNDVTRLTFSARYRTGDVLSYATPPRPELASLAPNRMNVGTFHRPMVAYSIDAHTWSTGLSLSRALNESSAIVVGYEWRSTHHNPLSYVNNIVSVALVHQF